MSELKNLIDTVSCALVDMPENVGANSKIILANDGEISAAEKAALTEYFGPMWQFKDPVWY